MNLIYAYMIIPREIVESRKNKEEYISIMQEPYMESLMVEAKSKGVKIGKIRKKDFGYCSKDKVAVINRYLGHSKEHDIESYVIKFEAEALQEVTA